MVEKAETLRREGVARLAGLVHETLPDWESATQPFFDLSKPGHRVSGSPAIADLAAGIALAPDFVSVAGAGWRCVRAIAFNKAPRANWSLGWHQDRTIAVARREHAPGFDVWSQRDGIVHVEPPFALLERMVTVRVHLDPVDDNNAPLLVARGSHRRGKVSEDQIEGVVEASSKVTCHADAGDVWIYATPVLHASDRSNRRENRRVIHLDFSRDELPPPLEWAGIA